MASLLDRFNTFFGRTAPSVQVTTTTDEMSTPRGVASAGEKFAAETERVAMVKACREMYKTDPRARGVITTLARDACKGGFEVKVKNKPEAEAEAARLVKRLKLGARLDDWARLAFRDGDSLLEAGVDRDNQIALVTRKPTLQMHRNSNYADTFDDPRRAFWFSPQIGMFYTEPPEDALWFAQWQIVHARWQHDEGSRYGEPLFGSATSAWKRVKEGEIDISVRRKTRAGRKFLHVLEDASSADIEAYKEENKIALDNPFAAVADFFSNKKGAISAIEGDARLQEIGDVIHHIRTCWLAGIVPMSLLGYGQDLNRDVLEEQKAQYERALESVTQWVEAELVAPLLELQWLLKGFYPEALEYEVVWKSKYPLTAKDLADLADAILKLRALGLGDEVVFSLLSQFLPGIDSNLLKNTMSDSQRLANAASAMEQRVAADDADDVNDDEDASSKPAKSAARPRNERATSRFARILAKV